MTSSLEELAQFLQLDSRLDLKYIALDQVTGLTASEEFSSTFLDCPGILAALITLLGDDNAGVSKQASEALINISATEKGAAALVYLDIGSDTSCSLRKSSDNIVLTVLKCICDSKSQIADECCIILSNLSRPSHLVNEIVDQIEKGDVTFQQLINVFGIVNYNVNKATLAYLGPVLSNLSQSPIVRKYILNKDDLVLQRLLPFTEYKDSAIRRKGVIGMLKNCCFDSDYHEWLLGEDVDILPRLLLPLAGNEEFDEDDNDKLPVELQYLPEDKTREEDPEIRCMLLETINQLCALRKNREFIRHKNTYVILRELHKWEKNKKVLLACQNVVDILIRTEEEIGQDNLKDIEVPEHLKETFQSANEEYLNQTNSS